MSLDDDLPEAAGSSRRLLAVCLAVLLVAVAGGGIWLLRPHGTAAPTPAPKAAAPAPQAAPVVSAPAASEATPPEPAVVPSRRGGRKANLARPSPEPAPSALVLKVDSDVPGASVFIDRNYAGKTPLTTSDVNPGSHVVHVSAEGYESQANTVEVTSGTTELMVRFKAVRLNEAVPVIHKHTIGSCEGRLVADLQGLRYETANGEHAFALPFSELRSFEVDYLKKNLRVVRKDGKTFNFTDRNANADALFVFHKHVEAARAKLAAGFAPDR